MFSTTIQEEIYYWMTSMSGHRTRFFLNEEDARAERIWLDTKWLSLQIILVENIIDHTLLCQQASEMLLSVMKASQRGLRKIGSPSLPAMVRLFRSEGPGEEPTILVVYRDNILGFCKNDEATNLENEVNLLLQKHGNLNPTSPAGLG